MIGLQNATIDALYTLDETIAKELFAGLTRSEERRVGKEC